MKQKYRETIYGKDYRKWKFSGCNNCAKCCNGSHFLIGDIFYSEIAKLFQLFPIIFHISNDILMLKIVFTLEQHIPCIYFNADNKKCLIYQKIRPMACREFPFYLIPDNNSATFFKNDAVEYDCFCPSVKSCEQGIPIFDSSLSLSEQFMQTFIGNEGLKEPIQDQNIIHDFLYTLLRFKLLTRKPFLIDIPEKPFLPPYEIDIITIDEIKLKSLSDKDLSELHSLGFMYSINQHLSSLQLFQKQYMHLYNIKTSLNKAN